MRKLCAPKIGVAASVLLSGGLLTSCATLGGDLPGLFYRVQLTDRGPDTVCLEFARDLAASVSLRVVGQTFPTRPKGACIVEFDSLEQSFRGTSQSTGTHRPDIWHQRERHRHEQDNGRHSGTHLAGGDRGPSEISRCRDHHHQATLHSLGPMTASCHQKFLRTAVL